MANGSNGGGKKGGGKKAGTGKGSAAKARENLKKNIRPKDNSTPF